MVGKQQNKVLVSERSEVVEVLPIADVLGSKRAMTIEIFLQDSSVAGEFLGGLMLKDVLALVHTCSKIHKGCSSLAGVIAFALTRPQWGLSHQIRLQKMSLREWSLVFQSFTQMLQSPEWSVSALTIAVTRTVWTAAAATSGGVRSHIDILPSRALSQLVKSMCLDCYRHGGFEDLEDEGRASFVPFIVLALKGSFAYVQDSDAIPAFGLACLLRFETGRFAFMGMSDPRRDWIQMIISSSLQGVVTRVREKFGVDVFAVDEFGQLPWVRGKPPMWCERGRIYKDLVALSAAHARCPAHRQASDGCLAYIEFREKYGILADERWAAASLLVPTDSKQLALIGAIDHCRSNTQLASTVLEARSSDPPELLGELPLATMEGIDHQEPAAVLDEHEAAQVCQLQWAGHVERLAKDVAARGRLFGDDGQVQARSARSLSCTDLDAKSSNDTPSESAKTAPAEMSSPRCLLPHTEVETRPGHFVNATELERGQKLYSANGYAVISAVRHFAEMDRDVVQIQFESANKAAADEQLVVTASHALAIFRPSCRTFQPVLASEVCQGDCLRTQAMPVRVKSVSKLSISTSVIEVELCNMCSSMYITTGGTPVEAYGATLPKLKNNQVKILSFNRFDNFRQLLENEELATCLQALTRKGLSADLSVYGLGPGKMFVQADLAERLLEALELRKGPPLKCDSVVVSSEFEAIVKLAAGQGAQRTIFVKSEEVLVLSKIIRTKRTFLDLSSSASHDGSAVVCSTTDANTRKGKNPRKCKKVRAD